MKCFKTRGGSSAWLLLRSNWVLDHVDPVRSVYISILGRPMSIVLVSGWIHLEHPVPALWPSKHHLRLALRWSWVIVHRLGGGHHGVAWVLHWLSRFILCLHIHHRSYHRWWVWRCRPRIWLKLWLLHVRRDHATVASINCILVSRRLRLVLVRTLHHVIFVHDWTRGKIRVAVAIWSAFLWTTHGWDWVDLIIWMLILVSMCRIIIIWILHADWSHLISLPL